MTMFTTAAPLGLQLVCFWTTYSCNEKAFADSPAAITGITSRLDILVLVLAKLGQRLAGQVALTDKYGRYVYHAGGRAGSTLLVKGWQKRDAFGIDVDLRDDFRHKDFRNRRLDGINFINVRPKTRVVGGVFGGRSSRVWRNPWHQALGPHRQLLDVDDIGFRAKSSLERKKKRERTCKSRMLPAVS